MHFNTEGGKDEAAFNNFRNIIKNGFIEINKVTTRCNILLAYK